MGTKSRTPTFFMVVWRLRDQMENKLPDKAWRPVCYGKHGDMVDWHSVKFNAEFVARKEAAEHRENEYKVATVKIENKKPKSENERMEQQ